MDKTVKKSISKKGLLRNGLLMSAALGGMALLGVEQASAHGYVADPPSRGYVGKLEAQKNWTAAHDLYGAVITNPQSLEAPKGFNLENTIGGPADGHIASADGGFGQIGDSVLDFQSADRWKKQDMNVGENTFTWAYTAPHRTSEWRYYITKKGWDPNDKLERSDFELMETIKHDNSSAENHLSHKVNIPSDRSGYNVILAVWDVADTTNAFYNVIDVNLHNDSTGGGETTPDKEAPTKPSNLKTSEISSSKVNLKWDASTDNTGVTEYEVFRDGTSIGTTSGTTYEDRSVKDNTKYVYTVQAKDSAGNKSEMSESLHVQTPELPVNDQKAPSVPTNVHSMKTTEDSVDLMWTESTDDTEVAGYNIYRDGKKVGTTKETKYSDTNLNAGTEYKYEVTAFDTANNESEKSSVYKVTTKGTSNEDENEWKAGSFTNPITYKKDQIVSYKGKTYKTIVTHNNYGDTTWSPDNAPSLFAQVK